MVLGEGDNRPYQISELEMNSEGDGYFEVTINDESSMTIKVIENYLEEDIFIMVNKDEKYYIRIGE